MIDAAQVSGDAGDPQVIGAGVAALCVLLTLFAAWRERRHVRRHDPDAVGWLDWTAVQMLALIALAIDLLVLVKT